MEAVLFGDEPCAPRCWRGITPGVSTEEDVLRILERLKIVGVVEDYDRPSSPGDFTHWVYLVGVDKVTIRLEDDRVEFIEGFYLHIGYRIEQAIESLGEPEAVVPYYRMNDRFSCEEWNDFIATTVPPSPSWLLYPAQGITLVLDTPAPGVICPQMFISGFLYYQPRSLAKALDEDGSPVFGFNITSQEDLVEWHGYGQGY